MMTNDELAQEIEVSDQRVKYCRTAQDRYAPHLEHLKALLAEQRRRALVAAPEADVRRIVRDELLALGVWHGIER